MRQIIVISLLVASVMGCSTNVRSPELAKFHGAEFEQKPYGEDVAAVAFNFSGRRVSNELLASCIAENVSNRSVSLQDQAGSFIGAYTGHYYRVDSSRETGGGSVLSHVGKDGMPVVAEGSTEYQAGAFVRRSVRFTLYAKAESNTRSFRFSKLEQAQLDSGAAKNIGYGKIGAWPGANPDLALGAMQMIAENTNRCLDR